MPSFPSLLHISFLPPSLPHLLSSLHLYLLFPSLPSFLPPFLPFPPPFLSPSLSALLPPFLPPSLPSSLFPLFYSPSLPSFLPPFLLPSPLPSLLSLWRLRCRIHTSWYCLLSEPHIHMYFTDPTKNMVGRSTTTGVRRILLECLNCVSDLKLLNYLCTNTTSYVHVCPCSNMMGMRHMYMCTMLAHTCVAVVHVFMFIGSKSAPLPSCGSIVLQMTCNCFISQKPVECFSGFKRVVLG